MLKWSDSWLVSRLAANRESFQRNRFQWTFDNGRKERKEKDTTRAKWKKNSHFEFFTGQELFYFIDGSADHYSFLLVFKKLACLENTIAEITWVWKIKKAWLPKKIVCLDLLKCPKLSFVRSWSWFKIWNYKCFKTCLGIFRNVLSFSYCLWQFWRFSNRVIDDGNLTQSCNDAAAILSSVSIWTSTSIIIALKCLFVSSVKPF